MCDYISWNNAKDMQVIAHKVFPDASPQDRAQLA